MPHKCAACSRVYDNYAVEIVEGCKCGSKIFLYERLKPVEKTETVSKHVVKEKEIKKGTLPGPASRMKFVEEVKEVVKDVSKGKKKKKPKFSFDLDTIRIIEDGVYEIDVNRILNDQPLVIELKEDGKYYIHLASVFKKKLEGLEKEDLDLEAPKGKKTVKKKGKTPKKKSPQKKPAKKTSKKE